MHKFWSVISEIAFIVGGAIKRYFNNVQPKNSNKQHFPETSSIPRDEHMYVFMYIYMYILHICMQLRMYACMHVHRIRYVIVKTTPKINISLWAYFLKPVGSCCFHVIGADIN